MNIMKILDDLIKDAFEKARHFRERSNTRYTKLYERLERTLKRQKHTIEKRS